MDEVNAEAMVQVDAEAVVTVGRFADPTEAQMAKGMLEAAGVECFLQGQHANEIYPMALRSRLLVRVDDEAAARELLGEAQGVVEPAEDEGEG